MDGLFRFVLPFLVAFSVSLFLIPVARTLGWVDNPLARKQHEGPIPVVGGVAIFLAIAATAFLEFSHGYDTLLVFGAILLLFGVYDDVRPLSAKFRFVGQGAAAAIAVLGGGVVLYDFGNLVSTGVVTLGLYAAPLSIFCIVGVINAFNMSDGIDGLAGGLALVTLLSMAYLANGSLHADFLTLISV